MAAVISERRRLSWLKTALCDCPGVSHVGSMSRSVTARVEKRAVAFNEINSSLLKARKQAIGQHRSKRGIMTARVKKRAVASGERTFKQVLAKT